MSRSQLGSTPALRMRRVPRLHHPSQRKQLQAPRHGHCANATVRMRRTPIHVHGTKAIARMRAIRSTVPRLRASSEGDFQGDSSAARMRRPSLLLPNQEQEVSCRPGIPRSVLGNAVAVRVSRVIVEVARFRESRCSSSPWGQRATSVSNVVVWALLCNAVLHGGKLDAPSERKLSQIIVFLERKLSLLLLL